MTNQREAPIATPLLLPAAASRASLGSCCRSCDWSNCMSLKRPRPIGKGHSRGLLANPSARFPFPISREPLSITLFLAAIGWWGGAAPGLFPPRRCGRWRSWGGGGGGGAGSRGSGSRSRAAASHGAPALAAAARRTRAGVLRGRGWGHAAMKARAARGPCRRRRSGNGRRGGGAGQVWAGRQRGVGPLRGRGSLPAQGSHCGEVSGAFWGAGARRGRVRPGGAGEGRRAPRESRALIRGQGSGSARRGSLPGRDCLGNVRFAERCEGLAWVLLF